MSILPINHCFPHVHTSHQSLLSPCPYFPSITAFPMSILPINHCFPHVHTSHQSLLSPCPYFPRTCDCRLRRLLLWSLNLRFVRMLCYSHSSRFGCKRG